MPVPGRATVSFTLLAGGVGHHTPESAAFYLDEYLQEDPRVRDLLAGSRCVLQATCRIAIDDGPARAARDGFLGLGDAATPAAHVGVLPAMYLGRRAALVAAEALDSDDVSGRRLTRVRRDVPCQAGARAAARAADDAEPRRHGRRRAR